MQPWSEQLQTVWRRAQRQLLCLWQNLSHNFRQHNIRPGWFILGGLFLYAIFATVQWQNATAALRTANTKLAVFEKAAALENAKLSLPIAGVRLPDNPNNWPGAARAYRRGVSQGFVFTGVDAGLQIQYGMPVLAAADGEVKFLSSNYKELSVQEFQALLSKVKDGASQADLMALRGRQVALIHQNGMVTRYCHLSSINPNLSFTNNKVKRGQVIGFVGNSGTLDGARGNKNNARLLFEIWLENESKFFGSGLKPETIRLEAAKIIGL
ncbi:MAG: M23 family metallopeptidase [Deinococcales bacterium]